MKPDYENPRCPKCDGKMVFDRRVEQSFYRNGTYRDGDQWKCPKCEAYVVTNYSKPYVPIRSLPGSTRGFTLRELKSNW